MAAIRKNAAPPAAVPELDTVVIDLNRKAMERMSAPTELRFIPDATHLFEEPGTLETVAHEAAGWFRDHLGEEEKR